MKTKLILAILLFFGYSSKAQLLVGANKLVPSIKVGYTIHGGITIGAEARYTFNANNPATQTGMFASKTWVRHNQTWQSIYANGLFFEKQNYQVAVGLGKAKKNWGYNKRNHCSVFGIYGDVGYTIRKSAFAYTAGLQTFWYKESKYRWFTGDFYIPYLSGAFEGKPDTQ